MPRFQSHVPSSNSLRIKPAQSLRVKSLQDLVLPGFACLVPFTVLPSTHLTQPAVPPGPPLQIQGHNSVHLLQSNPYPPKFTTPGGFSNDDLNLDHLLYSRVSNGMIRYAATYVSRFFPITGLHTPPRTPTVPSRFNGSEVLPFELTNLERISFPYPYPTLERFIRRLVDYSGSSVITLFIALAFVNRAQGRWSYNARQDSPPPQYHIILICTLLACKYHHDEVHQNSRWCSHLRGMFELKDINAMERHLLHQFRHNVTVTAEEIKAQFRCYMRTRSPAGPMTTATRPIFLASEHFTNNKLPVYCEKSPSFFLQRFTQNLPPSRPYPTAGSSMPRSPERSSPLLVASTTVRLTSTPCESESNRTIRRRDSSVDKNALSSIFLPRSTSAHFPSMFSQVHDQSSGRDENSLVFVEGANPRNSSGLQSPPVTTSTSFSLSKKGLSDLCASIRRRGKMPCSEVHPSVRQTSQKRSSDHRGYQSLPSRRQCLAREIVTTKRNFS